MERVRQIAREIVAREGGYVNDPDDPGGATKYGVTLDTLRRLGRDKDGDGVVGAADVRALSRADAEEIFVEHYYHRPRIDALPQAIQATVFDMQVNAGAHAVRLLQRLMQDMGLECSADGVIGPQTIACAMQASAMAPDHLADAYAIARRNYYYRLADARPASRKFARRRDGGKGGWIARAEHFMAERFRFSAEDHARRVAQWA